MERNGVKSRQNLRSDEQADCEGVGQPRGAKILQNSPPGQLQGDDMSQHRDVKPRLSLEKPCVFELLAQSAKVLLERCIPCCKHLVNDGALRMR